MNNLNIDRQVAIHFDEIAEHYANNYKDTSFFAYFFNQRLEIVTQSLDRYDRATILDVGCGPGMMAEYTIAKGFDFFGIDISEKMIDECNNNFGHISSTHFSVGKLQKLDFPDAFFDVVLCMGALEYVQRDEVDTALSEMMRVLKPDGKIIMSVMNKNSFFAGHRRAIGKITQKLKGLDRQAESYDNLSRPFTENQIRTLFKAHQLRQVDTVCFGSNIYPYFLEHKIPDRFRVKFSKILDGIFKGRFKWPYMAFIVTASK
jgi:2-polyprenyl-3-methyl-5-hydroxy-6-metoxy-1,4-benzoquinol methylase